MNILAIGAHPDDIEINCGGTLLRYREEGHGIYLALMTSGNIGSNVLPDRETIARTREAEQLAAALFYDAQVRFLRHDDEAVEDTAQARRDLLNAIRWADPDVIFTHFPGDNSTDHNVTGSLVGRVMLCLAGKNVPADVPPIRKHPSVFFWDTPAGLGFEPEVYVDITSAFERKLQATACHQSQLAWLSVLHPHALPERLRIQASFRGLQNGVQYAEGFRAFRLHGAMPDFSLLPRK
jgi:LmbE family N-acetylglucosaminyl deacetylase